MALDLDDLTVDSFATAESIASVGGGFCCTGCDSGCGDNPTGGGCESGSDQPYCAGQILMA